MDINQLRKLAGLPLLETTTEYEFDVATEEHGQYKGEVDEPEIDQVSVTPAVANGSTSPFVSSAPKTSTDSIPDQPAAEDFTAEDSDEGDDEDDALTDLDTEKPKPAKPVSAFHGNDDDADDEDESEKETGNSDEGETEEESDEELKRRVPKGDDVHETYLNTLLAMAGTGNIDLDRAQTIAESITNEASFSHAVVFATVEARDGTLKNRALSIKATSTANVLEQVERKLAGSWYKITNIERSK